MYLGLPLKLGKNHVMSIYGLLGERTKDNAHGGNIGNHGGDLRFSIFSAIYQVISV